MTLANAFEQFVDATEKSLDSVVDSGGADELFVASYLHGHFSLISSQIDPQQPQPLVKLEQAMQASLDAAFANQELAPEDQHKVRQLWQRLYAAKPQAQSA